MEKKSVLEKAFYSTFLDNVDVGIAIYDAVGNYVFVNTKLVNWRNIPRSKFLKMNVHDFLGVVDVCVFDLVLRRQDRVSSLQSYSGYNSVQGTPRLRLVTGTPIFNDSGSIQYVLCTLQDVDDFDQLRNRLLKENKVVSFASDYKEKKEKQEIVSNSAAFKELLAVAANVAEIDSSVLLYGESGSGKEVLAHYIHERSSRSEKPMVIVNCASIPENLIESELFGYEKGSFTGANREGKVGLIESAHGGTLFLDEINSLPMNVQGKLLRALEEKSVLRIGATRAKPVDFRLISATNRDLSQMIAEGLFREDLYYRIQVIPLTIPPLRSRREDIIPLCLYYLNLFCGKYNIQKSFSDAVLAEAEQYDWPGNVREVRNFVERMVVMTPRTQKAINSIPVGMLNTPTYAGIEKAPQGAPAPSVEAQPQSYQRGKKPRLQKEQIEQALEQAQGSREEAAELLGISRRYLQYKIKEFHISSRCRYADGEDES